MRLRGSAVVAACLLAMAATADTYRQQPGIRVTNYAFDINLDDANDAPP